MNILLAYVSLPFTTAAYWERALRKVANVKTIGPKLPEKLIVNWSLQNLKAPILNHDIDAPMDIDMSAINPLLDGFNPELYLWIESVPGYFPKNLDHIKCPKACYLIDTYGSFDWHIEWAKNFDYVFLADLSFVERFRQAGMKAFWMPVGCDPEIHIPQKLEKTYDIGFVGTVMPGSDRESYLTTLAKKHKLHYERSFLQEMATTFAKSKIVFNNAVGKTDLNMRFFEAMSTGTLLLADMSRDSGQNILFEPHRDYALYDARSIIEVADYYLENELARETIAKHGQELVLAAHTYQDRVDHFLEVVSGKYIRTYNPTEWRDLAQSRVKKDNAIQTQKPFAQLIDVNSVQRSFIIPVLDYSPASPYNIKTLLDDLSQIGGEVIVVFNSELVANEIKNHPRVDHYAVLKENVGVARAWNLGLDMCRTDYAFILNADLHITKGVIEQLHEALKLLPHAAIVGPQGSYFNFETLKDYIYLDKGTFNTIMEVDAVSGFLFGLKTEPFQNKSLRFESNYTPCYFEEWDLGLQIKGAGLKSYVIPLNDYDHQWSGSIRSYRQILYYDQAQTAKQIQLRNAALFQEKWRNSNLTKSNKNFLRSIWFNILVQQANTALANNQLASTRKFLAMLGEQFPGDSEAAGIIAKFDLGT